MRFVVGVFGLVFVSALATSAQGQVDFVGICSQTTPRSTCECISSKIPADKRAAAIDGLRKSNAAMAPGGNLLDPSNLSQEQMQGLDAVVIAQANCT